MRRARSIGRTEELNDHHHNQDRQRQADDHLPEASLLGAAASGQPCRAQACQNPTGVIELSVRDRAGREPGQRPPPHAGGAQESPKG
jgi:hypothetical protein